VCANLLELLAEVSDGRSSQARDYPATVGVAVRMRNRLTMRFAIVATTSPASAASPVPTSRNGSTCSTAPTPASKTACAQARPGDFAGCPSHDWTVDRGWVLAANLVCDLGAWTRLLDLHDQPDLAHAKPDTLRYRLWRLPARPTRHARRRRLNTSSSRPWPQAFTTCWQRLCRAAPTHLTDAPETTNQEG
jgi:hypothetical protein